MSFFRHTGSTGCVDVDEMWRDGVDPRNFTILTPHRGYRLGDFTKIFIACGQLNDRSCTKIWADSH